MQMTKRDVADIALLWILSSVLLSLLMSMASIAIVASYIGWTKGPNGVPEQAVVLGFVALQILVLLLFAYVLLFKRAAILSFLFPDGNEKEIAVPAGMESLASYGFWIRLLGIFKFLSSGVELVSSVAFVVAVEWPPRFEPRQFLNCSPTLVGVILSAAIIWKADWIAEKLEKLKAKPENPSIGAETSR
jgi:hypothetical protein